MLRIRQSRLSPIAIAACAAVALSQLSPSFALAILPALTLVSWLLLGRAPAEQLIARAWRRAGRIRRPPWRAPRPRAARTAGSIAGDPVAAHLCGRAPPLVVC